MKTLFDSNIEDNISMEMIDRQVDDPFVKDMISYIEGIQMVVRDKPTRFKAGLSFFKDRKTKAIIDSMDKLIFKRFGLDIKHTNAGGGFYAIIPVAPIGTNNVLDSELDTIFSTIEEEAHSKNNIAKDKDDIVDINLDWDSAVKHIYNSFNALDEKLDTSHVKIDYKKAYISNLPKDYKIYALCDFYNVIIEAELTAKEITAIILHEIGHAFTHLATSYRVVQNNTVLLDTLVNDVLTHKKEYKKAISIYYTDVLKKDKKDIDGKNSIGVTLALIDAISDDIKMDKKEHYSYIDSEQQADQFVTRFGLGAELGKGLTHIINKFTKDGTKASLMFLLLQVMYAVIMAGTLLAIPSVLVSVLVYTIVMILINKTFGTPVYDDNVRRLKRVRLDMIRQIRGSDIDKKDKKELLSQIDKIDKYIPKITSGSKFQQIVESTAFWTSDRDNRDKFQKLIEDMMENDLHVAAAKLDTV